MSKTIPDGAVDAKGDLLPELSKSANNMKMGRLLNTPAPSFEGKTPGSRFWTWVAFTLARRVRSVQFRTSKVSGYENIPNDRGVLFSAWHTNGLIDALGIMLPNPKYFVMGGRHDLVTRPILGWWTRKLAVQPVVRKAELLRGGCSEEEATHLNGKTLLSLSKGISRGFGCVLFPEGTSHDESHMIRFRTGPMRTVLAAAAISISENKPLPVIVPVGLHYRVRHYFRTDQWIEFGKPIIIEKADIPQQLVEAVKQGKWVEPPADQVLALREKLRPKLMNMTPNTSDWDDYRGIKLLAHIESKYIGQPIQTWKEEVLAARAINKSIKAGQTNEGLEDESTYITQKLTSIKHKAVVNAGKLLNEHNLDGRDLNPQGLDLRRANLLKIPFALVRLCIFLALLPISVISLGFQVTLGRLLGDSTDEGVDARTSFQFLAALFGSILAWPIAASVILSLMLSNSNEISEIIEYDIFSMIGNTQIELFATMVIIWIGLLFLFFISGHICARTWDDWSDFKKAITRLRMSKVTRQNLRGYLLTISNNIGDEANGTIQT
jgi:1-acyl-sn-glycerol-3-phosphate acyltransferase